MKKLVIIGAGGHGKVVADIALLNGYTDIVFLDDNKNISECAGFSVVGPIKNISYFKEDDVFIAIGNNAFRAELADRLSDFRFATLIHPNAIISRRVTIGAGTVIMAGAVVNSDTQIGGFCIVNTGATIDHDCILENFVHVSVGVHIAGNVFVGNSSWFGIGSTISNNLRIKENVILGAGGVVVRNISDSGTYVGIPAKRIK